MFIYYPVVSNNSITKQSGRSYLFTFIIILQSVQVTTQSHSFIPL